MKQKILAALLACVSTVTFADVTLKFTREDAFTGGLANARVFINDVKVGEVGKGELLEVKANSGQQTIRIDKSFGVGEYKNTFQLEDKAVYEVEIGPRGMMVGMALLGGLALIADNKINQENESTDNGIFTIKKFDKK